MTTDNGRAFNEWLRAQLKAKKMSQRQLAQQSGVDHSTISRLIRGDRMPSLGTATKLARGLREIRDDADTSTALGVVSVGPQNPTARVEYALRADEALSEPQVRQIMEYYLAVRVRRFARTYSSVGAAEPAQRRHGLARRASTWRPAGMAGAGERPHRPPHRSAAALRGAATRGASGPDAGSTIDQPIQGTTRPSSTSGSRGQRTPACRGRRSRFWRGSARRGASGASPGGQGDPGGVDGDHPPRSGLEAIDQAEVRAPGPGQPGVLRRRRRTRRR